MKNKLLLFIFLWLPFYSYSADYQYELSVCAIFKNEAPYLKEWIEFHRLVGVQHFYLCSHNSEDNYREVLKPYLLNGLVELTEWQDQDQGVGAFNYTQCKFYKECLKRARNVSRWVAFIDSDEFLFPVSEDSLLTVLKEYRQFGGVGVNWQMFGTSEIDQIPAGELLIEHLICCADPQNNINKHVKSIVQPKRASGFKDPHHATYREGYYSVDTDKNPFEGPFSPYVQMNRLRVNHYWTRDVYYLWNVKIPRRQGWGISIETVLNEAEAFNQCVDGTILRFVPELKKRVFNLVN